MESELINQDSDRYIASLFASEAARGDIHLFLALNQEWGGLCDKVTEPAAGGLRLQWWADAVQETYAGSPPDHPLLKDLAAILGRHKIPKDWVWQMIDARRRDFLPVPNETMVEYESYAGQTAGNLQKITALLAAGADEDLLRQAYVLGQVWGMIGLLRSTAYHLRARRCFLPHDILKKHGLEPHKIMDFPRQADLRGAGEEIADKAWEKFLELDRNILHRNRCVYTIYQLCKIYRKQLEKCDFNLLDPRLAEPAPFRMIKLWAGYAFDQPLLPS